MYLGDATASDDGTARLWDVAPLAIDDPERVLLSVEVRTRRTIENGLIRRLTQAEWLDLKQQLDTLGGDSLNRSWDDLSEQERTELRTPLRPSFGFNNSRAAIVTGERQPRSLDPFPRPRDP